MTVALKDRLNRTGLKAAYAPHGRGATRPSRGSGACDEAHPLETVMEAFGQHGLNMEPIDMEVKQCATEARGHDRQLDALGIGIAPASHRADE